jgi:hypothetical protein
LPYSNTCSREVGEMEKKGVPPAKRLPIAMSARDTAFKLRRTSL